MFAQGSFLVLTILVQLFFGSFVHFYLQDINYPNVCWQSNCRSSNLCLGNSVLLSKGYMSVYGRGLSRLCYDGTMEIPSRPFAVVFGGTFYGFSFTKRSSSKIVDKCDGQQNNCIVTSCRQYDRHLLPSAIKVSQIFSDLLSQREWYPEV